MVFSAFPSVSQTMSAKGVKCREPAVFWCEKRRIAPLRVFCLELTFWRNWARFGWCKGRPQTQARIGISETVLEHRSPHYLLSPYFRETFCPVSWLRFWNWNIEDLKIYLGIFQKNPKRIDALFCHFLLFVHPFR